MAYTQGRISYKHYGKYVERMIAGLSEEKDRRTMARTVDNLARYMRTKSYEYNQEHPNNEVIVKDIKRMSGGAIEIDEVALNNLRSDYKQHFTARPQKGPQQRQQQRPQKCALALAVAALNGLKTTAHTAIRRNKKCAYPEFCYICKHLTAITRINE